MKPFCESEVELRFPFYLPSPLSLFLTLYPGLITNTVPGTLDCRVLLVNYPYAPHSCRSCYLWQLLSLLLWPVNAPIPRHSWKLAALESEMHCPLN